MTVIIRARLDGNALTDLTTIAKWPDEFYGTSNIHYGSRFIFDGEGRLFFSIGDRGQAELAQDLGLAVREDPPRHRRRKARRRQSVCGQRPAPCPPSGATVTAIRRASPGIR